MKYLQEGLLLKSKNNYDILPKLLSILDGFNPKSAQYYSEQFEGVPDSPIGHIPVQNREHPFWKSEHCENLINGLFLDLEDFEPPFHYIGPNEVGEIGVWFDRKELEKAIKLGEVFAIKESGSLPTVHDEGVKYYMMFHVNSSLDVRTELYDLNGTNLWAQ